MLGDICPAFLHICPGGVVSWGGGGLLIKGHVGGSILELTVWRLTESDGWMDLLLLGDGLKLVDLFVRVERLSG